MAKKILHTTPGMGAAMSADEVGRFLTESRLNAQIATIDGGRPRNPARLVLLRQGHR